MNRKTSVSLSTLLTSAMLLGGMVHSPLAHAAACDQPMFAAARAFTSHPDPWAVAVGDFNGDGFADLATLSFTAHTVTIWSGSGNSTFQTNGDYTTIPDADSVLRVNMNADGKLDLAVFGSGLLNSAVLLGNGNGTFQPSFTLSGIADYAQAVSDLNGDGIDDIVTAGSSAITVWLGQGNLTFTNKASYPIGLSESGASVAIGDVNGDGKPDIVVGTAGATEGHILVLLGNGAGTFQAPVAALASQNNTGLAIGDFNGDGTNDVAILNNVNGLVSIFLSNGDGTLHIRDFKLTHNTGPIVSSIRAADFNHDGKLDLVVGDFQIFVLLGNGDGTLQAPVKYNQPAIKVDIGDFNGDGIPDLVAGAGGLEGFPNVRLLLGNGDGTFQNAPSYPTGHGPLSVVTGDFNGDGKPDVAEANAFTNTISVLLNKGDGTYGTNTDYVVGTNPQSITVGDFNKDGKVDLAVACLNDTNVVLLLGNGDGTFQSAVSVGKLFIGASYIVSGDFNHDGKLDLAAPDIFGLTVFPGNGNGTFGVGVTSSTASLFDKAVVADLNHDGKPDVVVANFGTNTIQVLLGNGNSTFQTPVSYFAGTNVEAVAVGDLDGDGKLDIAAANFGCNVCDTAYPNGAVTVLLGNGDGTFQPAKTYVIDPSAGIVSVAMADVNGDGKPDLIVGAGITPYVWVLLNKGDGTFQKAVAFGAEGGIVSSIAVADVNGDGHPDFVIANQSVDTLQVFVNTCTAGGGGGQTNNADLAISNTVSPDPVVVDSNLTYTIVVTNLGAVTASSVIVTDSLPSSVTFVSASAGCTNIGGAVICSLGSITSGGSVTKSIVVSPQTTGTITNSATVSSTTADPDLANNTIQAITTVQQSGGGGGGGSLTATLSGVKQKCKTKNGATTCALSGLLTVVNHAATDVASVHIRFFLSPDTAYHAGVNAPLGEATSKTIKAGKTGKLKLKGTATASGSGQFILAVDDSDHVLATLQVP